MDPLVKLDDEPRSRPDRGGELGRQRRTGRRSRCTCGTTSSGRTATRSPRTTTSTRGSARSRPSSARTTRTSSTASRAPQEYNSCDPKKDDCDALADKVGVTAPDDQTLEVTLTSPQPWFIQQLSHHSFLAVNQKDVEQYGEKWTEAENIVTNGPFKLARWEHDSRIDLVKWDGWRDAKDVSLTRVNGRMITDGTTAVQAFEAGEIDAKSAACRRRRCRGSRTLPTYEQYPALGTYYYGINIKNITDVNQRRAMAMAIDRQTIIDSIAQADQLPATGYVPKGMPGFDTLNPNSQWLPPAGDIDKAKQLMSQVAEPEDGHQPAPERRARPQGDRSRGPGHVEGPGPRRHDQAAGVGAVPRVPGPAAGQVGRRLPARLDRRLPGRDQLPRPVDLRLGEQQHELLQQAVRRARRRGEDHQPGRADAVRRSTSSSRTSCSGRTAKCRSSRSTGTRTAHLENENIKSTFKINPLDQIDLTKVKVEG